MAFNPFHRFRKHQKAWFAGLTIMVMIVFILGPTGSSIMSGGDFFSDVSRWVSGRSGKLEAASLDGKDVTLNDLRYLRLQREMANMFMFNATDRAMQARAAELRAAFGPNMPVQALQMHMQNDDQILTLNQRMQGSRGGLYFGGDPRFPPMEILDFLVWKKEADRLGISLTDADVNREISRLTLNHFSRRDSAEVEKAMRRVDRIKTIWSPEALVAALKEEFRVRLAQEALGYIPGANNASPVAAAVTPHEFKQFFDDHCMKVEVGLLPVKVENFVAKVTGKPDEKELRDLYVKHKDSEYSPDSATPGFKQPKRVQVEWLSAKADSPVFKKLADETVLVNKLRPALGPALGNAVNGSGAFLVGTALVGPLNFDLRAIGAYQRKLREGEYPVAAWTRNWDWRPYPMHASSFKQPTAVAGAVGQAFGTAGGAAAPFAALSSYEAAAVFQEDLDRTKFGSTWILTNAMPTPLASAVFAAYGTPKEEVLSFDQVKDSVVDRETQEKDDLRYARNEVLQAIDREITAINKAKDQKMLDAYIADQVKRYDLDTGKSAELTGDYMNRFNLADDAGLKKLKEAYKAPPANDPTGQAFHFMMTRSQSTYQPEFWPPGREWRTADTAFLFWHKAEKKEAIVAMDDSPIGKQVRAEVERAWKFIKARDLAKKEAERILEEARKVQGNPDARKKALRDLGKRTLDAELIELARVGLMNRERSLDPKVAYRYEPPRIDDTKVPYPGLPPIDFRTGRITGPTPFAEKVVALRTKKKGDGAVIPDSAEGTYYIAVLLDVLPPDDTEFYEAYRDAASLSPRRDPFLTQFENERRDKYQKEFMERLRNDAKLEPHKDKLKELEDRPSAGDE